MRFIVILLVWLAGVSLANLSTRYGIYEDKVRIVFVLEKKYDFRIFTLGDPLRIVVDIFGKEEIGTVNLPEFIDYKIGKHSWGLRVVLLYNRPFSVKYFSLEDPFRIVVDIYREEELFREIMRIIKEEDSEDPLGDLIRRIYSNPMVYEKRVIVIDAGHGGKDPGAIGYGGIKEKDVNLAIAKKVAEFLRKDKRFKVILVRDGDYFVPLHRRALIAIKNRADLFISIHSDAAPRRNPRARGTQVFALSYSKAYEKRAKLLRNTSYAKLVLGKDASRSPVVRRILADMAIDVTLNESVIFARILSRELKKVLGSRVKFKGINRAGFAVLKTPGIPSVLIETGFITNPIEARRLKDPKFQRKVAWAIYRAVIRYFFGENSHYPVLVERP